ncbi:MAG: glycosyltransferase, partial [bacterium]
FRNEVNLGPVRNWIRCIELSKGKYGKILFSDDQMRPEFLSRTVPLLEDNGVGFVFTATQIGKIADSGSINYRWKTGDAVVESTEFIMDSLFNPGNKLPVSPGCAIFRIRDLRKNLLVEIPSPTLSDFASYGAGNDLLIYLLTAKDYPKVAYIHEPLSFFLDHSGSISISDGGRMLGKRYTQARIYFSNTYLEPVITQRLLIKVWYSTRTRWKKGVKREKLFESFLDPVPYMSPFFVFKEVAELGFYRIKNKIRKHMA